MKALIMNPSFAYLLQPSWRAFRNRSRSSEATSRLKDAFLFILGSLFWVGTFIFFYRVLFYFQGVPEISDLLAVKAFSMITAVIFSLLLFSNIITTLSTYYLSDDLMLLHAGPLELEQIYYARFLETAINASWMIVLFSMPVFGAYGVVYDASWKYYGALLLAILLLPIIAAGIGVITTMCLVSIFPAKRTKEILVLLGILMLIGLYLLFRFLQPERLFNTEELNQFIHYLAVFKTPSSAYWPNHWFVEFLIPLLFGKAGAPLFHFLLLLSTGMALVVMGRALADRIYLNGWMRSQEGKGSRLHANNLFNRLLMGITKPFSPQSRAVFRKDIKLFFRDTTQWTQVLLLGAIMVVYLYNFRVLDLNKLPGLTFYLENIYSFLNMGLAAFVVSAVAIRFVFPAVSQEGKAFWLIQNSPISIKTLLWSKFWMYLVPLLLLAEALTILSNLFLHVTPFMMALSVVTTFFITFGIVALGIGLGAIYPRFHIENISKIATGYGAIVYMIITMGFIGFVVILEAWPVYMLFKARLYDITISPLEWKLIAASFALVILLNGVAFILPMHLGIKHLEKREK